MGPRVVIVGAGIVGCALADELTARGWTRVTVLDQGGPERTGGSTSHASGLVFQTSGDRSLTRFARATVAKYGALRVEGRACFRPVGGLELAATRERLSDLHRRHGWATAAGIESHLLDPAECAALHPLLDREVVLGGLHVPSDGVAVPLLAARAQARAATERGAEFRHGVRVTGIDVRGGRVRGVETDQGPVRAEVVVSAAGMWGPLVGAMAGVAVPLAPMAHQYAWTTPLRELDVLQKLRGLVDPGGATFPVLRHPDADLHVREHGDRLGVGASGHRAMPADPAGLDRPGPDRGAIPSERTFTDLDFEPSWNAAQALLPALADAKVERGINGLFSFTPDGMPLLGETTVSGFWLAESVWITHSAGIAAALASWMVDGVPALPEPGADPRIRRRPSTCRPPTTTVSTRPCWPPSPCGAGRATPSTRSTTSPTPSGCRPPRAPCARDRSRRGTGSSARWWPSWTAGRCRRGSATTPTSPRCARSARAAPGRGGTGPRSPGPRRWWCAARSPWST